MAKHGALRGAAPETPLFVRPIYDTPSWVPAALDHGVLTKDGLWWGRFANWP